MFSAVGFVSIRYSGSPSCFQGLAGRVVAMQDHAMVEVLVDPVADHVLDVREIDHHAPRVELFGLDRDDGPAVVAVQVLALAVVVEQPVAVAEVDFARHSKHGLVVL